MLLFSRCHVLFFATPWTAVCQTPLSMGFSRQEYWSGLPFPPLGDLPDPGSEPASPVWQVNSLPLSHQGSPSGDANSLISGSCPVFPPPMGKRACIWGGSSRRESEAHTGATCPVQGAQPQRETFSFPGFEGMSSFPWAEEPGGLQSMGSQRVVRNALRQETTDRWVFPHL